MYCVRNGTPRGKAVSGNERNTARNAMNSTPLLRQKTFLLPRPQERNPAEKSKTLVAIVLARSVYRDWVILGNVSLPLHLHFFLDGTGMICPHIKRGFAYLYPGPCELRTGLQSGGFRNVFAGSLFLGNAVLCDKVSIIRMFLCLFAIVLCSRGSKTTRVEFYIMINQ